MIWLIPFSASVGDANVRLLDSYQLSFYAINVILDAPILEASIAEPRHEVPIHFGNFAESACLAACT